MSEGKTLLPEMLPAPTARTAATPGGARPLSPRERVAEHARLLLQRFRSLGPVAGAAVLGLHGCGYTVVDPLPPPPVQCTTLPLPFAQITATASADTTADASLPQVVLTLLGGAGYQTVLGFRVDAVRVTGGTLVSQVEVGTGNPRAGSQFALTIAPEAATSAMLVDVDLGCGAATTTKHYRVTYLAPAYPTVEQLPPT